VVAKSTKQNSLDTKIIDPKRNKFNFGKIFIFSTAIVAIIFSIIFGFAGEFESEAVDAIIGILIISVLIGVLATFIIRGIRGSDSTEKSTASKVHEDLSKYKGIEGWLTFVVLGLLVTAGYGIYNLLDSIRTYGSNNYANLGGLLMYDLLTSGFISIFASYVLYLLFKKKKKFPINFIVMLIVFAVIQNVTLFIANSYSLTGEDIQDYQKNAARAIFSGAVWILYTATSKRVKATFVEN